MGDEVGCNIDMSNDGHYGGQKYIGIKGQGAPKKQVSSKSKHWTTLGLTAFNGEPVMCIVILANKTRQLYTELGRDCTKELDGSIDDYDNEYEFLLKNSGKGKAYAGGPTCEFNGKEIPCLIHYSENGSITSEILTDILETLDVIDVYDRSKGIIPFLMLDGHMSRYGLPFLEYINDESHEWCVCIGVPYGTHLWQIGDSSQQNGRFKMVCYKKKDEIVTYKCLHHSGRPDVLPEDILSIVSEAWDESFADVQGNKMAIFERGYLPYNRNLLLHPDILSTMSTEDYEWATTCGLMPTKLKDDESLPTHEPKYLQHPDQETDLTKIQCNISSGFSSYVIGQIFRHEEIQQARAESIKKRKRSDEDNTSHETLKKRCKVSSGRKFLLGDLKVNNALKEVKYSVENDTIGINTAWNNKVTLFLKMKSNYDNAMLTANSTEGPLTGNLIKQIIPMLKRNGDGKTPGVNKDLFPYFERMRHRPPLRFSEYVKMKGLTVPDGIDENNLTPVMVGGGEAHTAINGNDDQEEDEWSGALDVKPALLASSVATEKEETEVANLL